MKIAHYFTPKSYMYAGEHTEIRTTIKDTHYGETHHEVHNGHVPNDSVKHYIQVIGLTDTEAIRSLLESFQVHPLQIEDVFNPGQRDKIEVKDHYVFAALHVDYMNENLLKDDYLSAFLFADTLITFHETPPEYLTPIPELLKKSEETKKRSASFLFSQLLDMITDHHMIVHGTLTEAASSFEETILEEAAAGGAIGLVESGDRIRIDIPNRRIDVMLSDEALARRRQAEEAKGAEAWKPSITRERKVSAALKAYALLATSADKGAVRDLTKLD